PDLIVTKTHSGAFTQGQTGNYSITVTNSGAVPTTGTVTVVDTLPAGLTATTMVGSGWSCNVLSLTCNRSDSLGAAGSYPPITLTVSVAPNATGTLINSVSVSGGGETNTGNDSGTDPTSISPAGSAVITMVQHVGKDAGLVTSSTLAFSSAN